MGNSVAGKEEIVLNGRSGKSEVWHHAWHTRLVAQISQQAPPAPRKESAFLSASCREFPFRLCRQPSTSPPTESIRIVPGDVHHGMQPSSRREHIRSWTLRLQPARTWHYSWRIYKFDAKLIMSMRATCEVCK